MHEEVGFLFADVTRLPSPLCRDVLTGRTVRVPRCDLLVGGFPCTTVSSKNNFAADDDHRNAVASGFGATGECFAGIRRYVRSHQPALVILENVKNLAAGSAGGISNLLACQAQIEAEGYVFEYWLLSPTEFSWPQERHRFYMVAVHRRVLSAAGMSDDGARDVMRSSMDALRQGLQAIQT